MNATTEDLLSDPFVVSTLSIVVVGTILSCCLGECLNSSPYDPDKSLLGTPLYLISAKREALAIWDVWNLSQVVVVSLLTFSEALGTALVIVNLVGFLISLFRLSLMLSILISVVSFVLIASSIPLNSWFIVSYCVLGGIGAFYAIFYTYRIRLKFSKPNEDTKFADELYEPNEIFCRSQMYEFCLEMMIH